jgi:hypothetical protein
MGIIELEPEEFCHHVYMPIMVNVGIVLPDNLTWVMPLIDQMGVSDWANFDYMYLTVKHQYVVGSGNRPGWHIDGFLSHDINYIWSDCVPTEFCIQEFDLSPDHEDSIIQMGEQACRSNFWKPQNNELVRLTPSIVHRAVESDITQLRTFVKISCSNSQYNLKGNATNPLLSVDWVNDCERKTTRNHPIGECE